MILRPRQIQFVDRCVSALHEHGNTLGVAPTGSGKTVCLSGVAARVIGEQGGSALILQHRDELVDQNRRTFRTVNPDVQTDVFNADRKRFVRGGATFAMVQTLCRESNLPLMKPVDLFVIDEAHHVAADSYGRIIDRAYELNPQTKIFGVTATPMRGDRKALCHFFTNVADVIPLSELIAAGHLVRPRCFVIDCGMRDELKKVRRTISDFDMGEVESIMDKKVVNEKVFEEWQKAAGDRQTVFFCSTVAHARHVMETFEQHGVSCCIVTGDTPTKERADTLAAFDRCEIQCFLNVAVAVEGWDCQPVSCVGLLRPCSHKSTMQQMIGRGLRRLDPERYQGHKPKDDCIVLDFGYSLLTHGSLESEVELDPQKGEPGEAPTKDCPDCGTTIPAQTMLCPICGHEFESSAEEKEPLHEFVLTEIDILNMSPYRWENFWDGIVSLANGMEAWAAVVAMKGRQYAIGCIEGNGGVHVLANAATRPEALSVADDYLRAHGNTDAARKSRSWLQAQMSEKQMQVLGIGPMEAMGTSRYRASCQITWKFNERAIRAKLAN